MNEQAEFEKVFKRLYPNTQAGTLFHYQCWEFWQARAALSISPSTNIQESALDKEVRRWQDAIYKVCKEAVGPDGDSAIDGGGCDSGDALDFTLTEIGQALAHLKEPIWDACIKAICRRCAKGDPLQDYCHYMETECDLNCGVGNPIMRKERHSYQECLAVVIHKLKGGQPEPSKEGK